MRKAKIELRLAFLKTPLPKPGHSTLIGVDDSSSAAPLRLPRLINLEWNDIHTQLAIVERAGTILFASLGGFYAFTGDTCVRPALGLFSAFLRYYTSSRDGYAANRRVSQTDR